MSEEAEKSGLVDWGSIETPKARGKKAEFLRLKSGTTAVVRLYHKPKPLYRYYNPANNKSAITDDPENCPVTVKGYKDKEGKPLRPKLRYAINVIDRADGLVKIMEAPRTVFLEFKKFNDNIGIDPGGPEACDFVISVKGSGLTTEYEVTYKLANKKPFTAEEKALLKENRYDLDEQFKPTPPDKIEAQLGLLDAIVAEEPEAPAAGGKGESDMPWGA